MCGLVGIAGDLRYKDELFMKRLLILDYFRGTDSTGLAAIRGDGSTVLAKAAVNPITFFDMKMFDKALDGISSKVFIGHNRAATLGKVNDANAHPYQFEEITGAHNGTLDKASWSRLEHEAGTVTNTDSAAIFACINEIGIDATIPLMETGRHYTTGAWALTYYNKVSDRMCFVKNEHRPLWYGFNKKRDKIYWASEWAFLDAAAKMTKDSDWDGWYADEEGFTFFPFSDDTLYEIDMKKLIAGLSEKDVKNLGKGRKVEGRKPAPLVPKVATPVNTNSGGSAPWMKNDKGSTKTGGTTTTTSKPSSDPDKERFRGHNGGPDLDDDIADFLGKRNQQVSTKERSKDHPLNGLVTEARFDELAKYGCSYCGADIDINDTGYTIYANEDVILCPECSKQNNEDIKLYLPPLS